AGTIDKEDQIRGYTDTDPLNGSCTSHILIPQYFYMCIMAVKNGQYKAIGFWTEHTTGQQLGTIVYADYAKSIDEIEQLTGLDFFCNLPDDIEAQVEATYNIDDWTQSSGKKRLP
ncbi:MAG: DNA/RNA non-specific endonuclease, partial [Muribaculaceae bacterium]|nr:DNA/RNA non-specific endonuclease [Muribaculaceae bacterium]